MNLQKINQTIGTYKKLIQDPEYDGWRLWELTHQFRENWDVAAPDFADMYRRSFAISSPLWHRDHYIPKKAMQHYIGMNDDLVRSMFSDLLDDSKDIAGRIGRFVFQCDELYKMDRRSNQKVLPHYHDDLEMIFIYLCFAYPDRYALYEYDAFKKYMDRVGATREVTKEDLERFVKVCRTLSALLQKDGELVDIIRNRVEGFTGNTIYPMLGVSEIIAYSSIA